MKTIWRTNTKVAFLCSAAITTARRRQTGTSLPAQTLHCLQMLVIPPSQKTLTRRRNENLSFLLAILNKAVKDYTLNIYQTLYNIHPHLQELKTNSDISKTISRRMWLEFVFIANTLQCISLNTAGGSCKALMTIIPVGDFSISSFSEMQVIISSVVPLYLQGYVQADCKHPM